MTKIETHLQKYDAQFSKTVFNKKDDGNSEDIIFKTVKKQLQNKPMKPKQLRNLPSDQEHISFNQYNNKTDKKHVGFASDQNELSPFTLKQVESKEQPVIDFGHLRPKAFTLKEPNSD